MPTRRKTLRKGLLWPVNSRMLITIREGEAQDRYGKPHTIFNVMKVMPVAHITGYVACKSVKPLMTLLAPLSCPALGGGGGVEIFQFAYLCHVCSILALSSELLYESVNVLVNGRFLLLQGATIERRSQHLADDPVSLRVWVGGNASMLSLDTLDFLSLDEGRFVSGEAGQQDIYGP